MHKEALRRAPWRERQSVRKLVSQRSNHFSHLLHMFGFAQLQTVLEQELIKRNERHPQKLPTHSRIYGRVSIQTILGKYLLNVYSYMPLTMYYVSGDHADPL